MAEDLKKVGTVSHYFSKINVAGIDVEDTIKVGDKVRIKGNTTDFEQKVESMQIDMEAVEEVKKGDEIGLKVDEKVRRGDGVYLEG